MVIIAIIGILTAIIVPTVSDFFISSKIKTANSSAATIKNIIDVFMLEMDVQYVGMKRGSDINAQIIFMVDNGEWLVKTECKVKGKNDNNGSLTFFDHTNWWYNNATAKMLDTTTRQDPNHQLALCRAVADACPNLEKGFIMAFFNSGSCRGVVYIPECNYIWPGKYPNISTKGRIQKRPLLIRGRNMYETTPGISLKNFSPWNCV